MKFVSFYSIIVGVLMLAQWAFFMATGQVPELQAEPYRIAFHLLGEVVTAIALIITGVQLLRRIPWAPQASFASLGMLTYTVLVSPGYFAQLGQWPLVGMFGLLLLLTLVSFALLSRALNSSE